MAAPATPRHKRLAIVDEHGIRASSTPPAARLDQHFLAAPVLSPSSRHSSPGKEKLGYGRCCAENIIPRRLIASPAPLSTSKEKARRRITRYHSIDHAVELLKNARNIVVLTGAGISTSLDIPDFRSDGGFYSKLTDSIGLSTPEEFFSLDFFQKNSELFWKHVKPLLPHSILSKDGSFQYVGTDNSNGKCPAPRFSKTHAFLNLLQAKGKLLTNYTQNIDNLEYAAGVRATKIVKCHGSWDTATCLTCQKVIPAKKYLPIVWNDGFPRCRCAGDKPKAKSTKTKVKKRKRAIYEGDSDHDSDDGTTVPAGLYKPDITFFGENIPEYYVPRLEEDKTKIDLLLVIGTSLKVRPVKTMVVDIPLDVPQVWINKDRFSGRECDMLGVQVDIELLGECDMVVEELCRRAGYPLHDFVWNSDKAGTSKALKAKEKQAADLDFETDANKVSILAMRERQDGAVDLSRRPPQSILEVESRHPEATCTQLHRTEAQEKAEQQGSLVVVTSDIEAEWRWRFKRKDAMAVNKGESTAKKDISPANK